MQAQVTTYTPLPGACGACHCQGPKIQGQLCGRTHSTPQAVAMSCQPLPLQARPTIPIMTTVPLPPPSLSEPDPLISCCFNPVLSGWAQMPEGDLHAEAGPKPKLNPRSCAKKRRKRKISLCSLRSSGLNPHNQLDEPCICGIPE